MPSSMRARHTNTRPAAARRHAQVWRRPPRTPSIGGGRFTHKDKDDGLLQTCTSVAAAAAHVSDWRWPRRQPSHDAQAGCGGRRACISSAAGARKSAPAAIGRGWRRRRPPPDVYKGGGRRQSRHLCVLGAQWQGRRPAADMH